MDIIRLLAQEFNVDTSTVRKIVTLFDKDNSLHFIARYRRDQTGGMEADNLRDFEKRLSFLRNLEEEQAKALAQLGELDILTDQIKDAILKSKTITDVKEIMAPYRSKRKTRASKAREMGYQPVADVILGKNKSELEEVLSKFSNQQEARKGAIDIVAEEVVNHPDCKEILEKAIRKRPITIRYKAEKDKGGVYKSLEELSDSVPVFRWQPHQIHALLRGEEEGTVSFSYNPDLVQSYSLIADASGYKPTPSTKELFALGLKDGVHRLLRGRAERAVTSKLKEIADNRAIEVFKENLFDLLTSPPIEPKVVLAIDPGFRSGCKVAVVDSDLSLLDITAIYPTPPKNDLDTSQKVLCELIKQHNVEFIAIGNGTASTETSEFVKIILRNNNLTKVNWAVVPETGASVYSASEIADQEFPHLTASQRGAISIARRILDPLAEYVKIDPKSLGVGQYQHSIESSALEEALDYIVDKAVSSIGIKLETASTTLLQHVAGLTASTAKAIVDARQAGKVFDREDLLKVKGIGLVTFEQAVGFLKVKNSDNPLDKTMIHPDHYGLARAILEKTDYNVYTWNNLSAGERKRELRDIVPKEFANDHTGELTVSSVIEELLHYGDDPRGVKDFVDRTRQPEDIEGLKEGMILQGEVSNVVDFGAFIDLGIKENGLIHVSNLADRYVSNVRSVVKIGEPVKVEVLQVDTKRKRIGLRLIEVNGRIP